MKQPDYSKYTLEELHEALSHINKYLYPERVKQIQSCINNFQQDIKLNTTSPNHFKELRKNNLDNFLRRYEQIQIVLVLITFMFGVGLLYSFLFNNSIQLFEYRFNFAFPGITLLNESTIKLIANIIILIIDLAFVLAGVVWIINIEKLKPLLVICWFILTFGVQVWNIAWFPSFFDTFSFTFNLEFIIPLGLKINFVPLSFTIWAIVIIPELKNKFLEEWIL